MADPTLTLEVLLDNERLSNDLEIAWGFSALLTRGDRKVLFDTAWDGEQVLQNASRLGVSLEDVNDIFLSHAHWDHAGGLPQLLRQLRPERVWVPASLSARQCHELSIHAEVHAVEGPQPMGDGLFSTGPLTGAPDQPEEQALVAITDEGPVVVVGCAHPGVEKILKRVRAHQGVARALIGGLHDLDDLSLLDSLQMVVPCHCTEKKAEILAAYPDSSRGCAAGTHLAFA